MREKGKNVNRALGNYEGMDKIKVYYFLTTLGLGQNGSMEPDLSVLFPVYVLRCKVTSIGLKLHHPAYWGGS